MPHDAEANLDRHHYECEDTGLSYMKTGEVREPSKGEWYLIETGPFAPMVVQATVVFGKGAAKLPILEPAPKANGHPVRKHR